MGIRGPSAVTNYGFSGSAYSLVILIKAAQAIIAISPTFSLGSIYGSPGLQNSKSGSIRVL